MWSKNLETLNPYNALTGEKKKQPQTNADRIRAMNDEELAKEMRSHAFALATCSEKAWLEWLQSPAKKEGE